MSRGSSLVAGVILIGMLSTFAVALQGATPTVEGESNVAAASLAQVKVVPKAPVAKAASNTRACSGAFERFDIYVEKGGPAIHCTPYSYDGMRCPDASNGAGCVNQDAKDHIKNVPAYDSTKGCATKYKGNKTLIDDCMKTWGSTCKEDVKEQFCPGPKSANGVYKIQDRTKKDLGDVQCGEETSCSPEKKEAVGKNASKDFAENNKDLIGKFKDANAAGKDQLQNITKGIQQSGGDTKEMWKHFQDNDLKDAENEAKDAIDTTKSATEARQLACVAGGKAADCDAAKQAEKDAKAAQSLKLKEYDKLKSMASVMQATMPAPGQPVFGPDGKCKENCSGVGGGGGPGGGGPGGGGNPFSNPNSTFNSKSMSDLGKMLSSMAQQPQQRPAPGSGSGAAGQPPQCTQTYNTSYDYYGSSQPSSTNCQCQSGLTLQNGYCQGGNQCPQGYVNSGGTCQPASATSPVATITSCEPRIQDVGQSVTITYSCQNAISAEGVGFTTNGVSGTGTALIEKQGAGVSKVSYGLICTGQNGQKAQARQCDVAVYNPTIVMVSNPTRIEKDKDTTIGWVTKGMKSCTVGSEDPDLVEWDEDQEGNTNVSGSVKTPSLDEDTEFILTCTTQGGNSKDSKITVDVM